MNTIPLSNDQSPTREKPPTPPKPSTRHTVLIRDSIIGFADGLTVPFALTAGLSSLGSTRLVVLGGLAELFAGSISMGLGAWLAATTDAKHYEVEEERERREAREWERVGYDAERVYGVLEGFGVRREECRGVVEGLRRDEGAWVTFCLRFEEGLTEGGKKGAWVEGIVMGVSYFLGGLLPMIPYFSIHDVNHALFVSIAITAVVLLAFGYAKAVVIGTTRWDAVKSAVQTLLVGAVAAAVSYGIVRAVNSAEAV